MRSSVVLRCLAIDYVIVKSEMSADCSATPLLGPASLNADVNVFLSRFTRSPSNPTSRSVKPSRCVSNYAPECNAIRRSQDVESTMLYWFPFNLTDG